MRYTILSLLLLSTFEAIGQLNVGGEPMSWHHFIGDHQAQLQVTQSLNLSQLAIQDSIDSVNGVPPRFAYPHPVNLNLENCGTWTQLADGSWIWQLKIYCPEALSISLLFQYFHLADHSVLHFYSSDTSDLKGGYTAWNNKGTLTDPRGFATGMVFADTAVLELHTTEAFKTSNILQISYIAHGYNFTVFNDVHFTANKGFGKSKRCQTDVKCSPEGDDWQDEKKGVAMIVVDGTRLCTGTLLNNTCNDGRLFFLTASHCVESGLENTDSELDAWSFWWDWEAETCNAKKVTGAMVTTGAELRMQVDKVTNDIALLELIESPIIGANDINFAYFNGWSRTQTPSVGGVVIHHPKGDLKKISIYDSIPQYSGTVPESWYINFRDTGSNDKYGVEKGSSGAPLYMNNGLVIGSLSGRESAFKCIQIWDPNSFGQGVYFGNLGLMWDYYNNDDERLSPWLGNDACGSQLELAGGYFYECPGNVQINFPIWNNRYYSSSGNLLAHSHIYDGSNVTFTAQDVIEFKAGFEVHSGAIFSARIEPCIDQILNKKSTTSYEFNEEVDLEKISTNAKIYPNPSQGVFNIKFEETEAQLISIEILDINGRLISVKSMDIDLSRGFETTFDLNAVSDGNYIIKIITSLDVSHSLVVITK